MPDSERVGLPGQLFQIRRRRNQRRKIFKTPPLLCRHGISNCSGLGIPVKFGNRQGIERLDKAHWFRKLVNGLVASASRRLGARPIA